MSSPRLDKVLNRWDEDGWTKADLATQRQKLAYVVLVELLAYQFASPVRDRDTGFAFYELRLRETHRSWPFTHVDKYGDRD
jgi:hypothetical protein